MKRFFLILLCLVFVFLLSSCEYDKSQDIKKLFSPSVQYRGSLFLNGKACKVSLSIPEEDLLLLCFDDGPLKGLEKRFHAQTECDLLEGMEFALPSPSDYYPLYEAIFFLAKQSYTVSSKEANNELLEFCFSEEEISLSLRLKQEPFFPESITIEATGYLLHLEVQKTNEEQHEFTKPNLP